MRASYPYLTEKLAERGISREYLAEQLGIDVATLELKFQGILQWGLVEAVRICCLLHNSDVEKIFSN